MSEKVVRPIDCTCELVKYSVFGTTVIWDACKRQALQIAVLSYPDVLNLLRQAGYSPPRVCTCRHHCSETVANDN